MTICGKAQKGLSVHYSKSFQSLNEGMEHVEGNVVKNRKRNRKRQQAAALYSNCCVYVGGGRRKLGVVGSRVE